MKPVNPPLSSSFPLDRRGFLRLSSMAAVAALATTAAVPPTQGLEPPGPASRRAGAKPDLHGRWFAV